MEFARLSSLVGWGLLGLLVLTVIVAVRDRQRLARFWLTTEDPRTMAACRIAFAALLFINNLTLVPYLEFFFSGEGMLPTGEAVELLRDPASNAPAGPVHTLLVGHFLYSWLWFWDSSFSVWLAFAALQLATLSLLLGFRARASAVITWALMLNLWLRNWLWWEGTENVFTVFGFYLIASRCGEAYSLDAWWRRRRGKPSLCPIPTWPRKLMMLQLAILYFCAGLLKYGETWVSGDAVYYAINLDHFYRFSPPNAPAWLGGFGLRVVTWLSRWIEVSFPLVFIGVFARHTAERALSRRQVLLWSWVFGRRVWLPLAAALQLGIATLMNIGVFQWITLACTLVYLDGDEIGRAVDWVRGKLGRPESAGASLASASGDYAYGRRGRIALSVFLSWHLFAVFAFLVPGKRLLEPWLPCLRSYTAPWLYATHTDQYWGMFGPDPPRTNVFLMAVATDQGGQEWDLHTDLYARDYPQVPAWSYDRFFKLSRILSVGEAGASERLRGAYARWTCRDWTARSGGTTAERVELFVLSYDVPAPVRADPRRPFDRFAMLADSGELRSIHVEDCPTDVQ